MAYRPPLSAAVVATIQEAYEAGVGTEAISFEQGVSRSGIKKLARRRGWQRPPGWYERLQANARFDPSPEQEAWLREQWLADAPTEDVAVELRVSRDTVRRLARRLGLPPRGRRRCDRLMEQARARQRRITRLWNAGMRRDEIAAVLGETVGAVQGVLGRARGRGTSVRSGCRPLVVTPKAAATIRDGYRLGVGIGTLVQLLDPAEGWDYWRVARAAKQLGLRHRNANDPVRQRLAPDLLMLCELDGSDPVDRVQKSFRRHPSFTVAAALAWLADYREALARFPDLPSCRVEPRGLKPTPFLRSPSAEIEAARGKYLSLHEEEALAA